MGPDDQLITFHLAHVAINFGYPSHRLYGLHLLYALLKNEAIAQNLKGRCNFSYIDFFNLAGQKPVITNYALYNQVNDLRGQNEELSNELQTIKSQLADSGNRLALVPNSVIKFFSRTRRLASFVKKALQN